MQGALQICRETLFVVNMRWFSTLVFLAGVRAEFLVAMAKAGFWSRAAINVTSGQVGQHGLQAGAQAWTLASGWSAAPTSSRVMSTRGLAAIDRYQSWR